MSRLLFFSLLFGAVGAMVAERKGRRWPLWGIMCFVFPFLIILLYFLPPVVSAGVTKRCPGCGQVIRHNAPVCKHCGGELPIDMVRCPHCGKFVPARDYCIECHRNLNS